ncbi:MAG: sodium/proton-translocating pyrophosphatase [Cypionkella sp.]
MRGALARGLYVTAVLHAVGFAGAEMVAGGRWLHFFACSVIGVAIGIALLAITQYYTEHSYRPMRESRRGLTHAARRSRWSRHLHRNRGRGGAAPRRRRQAAFGAFPHAARALACRTRPVGLAAATMGLLGPAATCWPSMRSPNPQSEGRGR